MSFTDSLKAELYSARSALVDVLLAKDRLICDEAPALHSRYMDTIGRYETDVLDAELELSLLRRKAELIQIRINRREPIDIDEIDRIISEERRKKLDEIMSGGISLSTVPQLSERDNKMLEDMYGKIGEENRGMTARQSGLCDKAREAYRLRDVEAMRLICDLLQDDSEPDSDDEYRLARLIFPFFVPSDEDAAYTDAIGSCRSRRSKAEAEISEIRGKFPFTAEATLNDRVKTEEYLAELKIRARMCEEETAELTHRIEEMTEGATHG